MTVPHQKFPEQPLNVCRPGVGRHGKLELQSIYWTGEGRAIPRGFLWEASVPKLARSLFYGNFDPRLQLASLKHDADSTFHDEWTVDDWKRSNLEFKRVMRMNGVNQFKANLGYMAVCSTKSYWNNTDAEIAHLIALAGIEPNREVYREHGNVFNFPQRVLMDAGL